MNIKRAIFYPMSPPGFIDLQVNGFKGIDFSAPELTFDDIRSATRALLRTGTIGYCPTLVTSPPEIYRRNLPLLARAMREKELSGRILGIHLEGPFISPAEGVRGAHPPEHIIPPSIDVFRQFQEWAQGRIAILTLAPETPGAMELIRRAARGGVLVSLGHHLADDDILARAVAAGARACTHLGNGLPNTINRHQNPLWWQLACDDLTGMFITDGHHLPDDFIRVALRSKGVERFIAVSDATNLASRPPGVYEFHGAKVTLASNGRIGFAATPYLAGSSATMLDCMNKLAALGALTERQLWQIGFGNPLRLLGRRASASAAAKPAVAFNRGQFIVL